MTRSNRFGIRVTQSSTVTRAMNVQLHKCEGLDRP
jgi:hypothetical protein